MQRRLFIVLGMLLVISGGLYVGGIALLRFSLTRSDLYPAFMVRYEPRPQPRSYDEAEKIFGELVAKTFPIGSDAESVVAEVSGQGFRVATSGANSVELVWKRAAGPCSEWYSISIQKDVGGKVAKIAGQLNPMCL